MGNRKAIKIDRKVLEAKYRAAQLIKIPHLKIAIWACRMRKIQKITNLINALKIASEQK